MKEALERLEKKLKEHKKMLEGNLDKEESGKEPEMAEPGKPKGLDNKRKPVTHDECGRPFAKEEEKQSGPIMPKHIEKWMNLPKAERDSHPDVHLYRQHMKVMNITDKELGKSDEVVKFDSKGQWKIEKSNYGPKDMQLYSDKDNAQRKAKNTGESFADVGKNVNAKKYTTSGASMQNAHDAAQNKKYKAEAKSKVKIFSDEEKRALQAKMQNEGVSKEDSNDDVAGGSENDMNTRL